MEERGKRDCEKERWKERIRWSWEKERVGGEGIQTDRQTDREIGRETNRQFNVRNRIVYSCT